MIFPSKLNLNAYNTTHQRFRNSEVMMRDLVRITSRVFKKSVEKIHYEKNALNLKMCCTRKKGGTFKFHFPDTLYRTLYILQLALYTCFTKPTKFILNISTVLWTLNHDWNSRNTFFPWSRFWSPCYP